MFDQLNIAAQSKGQRNAPQRFGPRMISKTGFPIDNQNLKATFQNTIIIFLFLKFDLTLVTVKIHKASDF